MATYAHRFRRFLSTSSPLLHHRSLRPLTSLNPKLHTINPSPSPCRFFTSTTTALASGNRSSPTNFNDNDEIGPDTILFEGCDYNHWLIVVDFPKDPKPSNDEMVRFYEDTASKIFASSEEAKKKIYACSTTTYTGFQVECSEETSEKFKDLPGVIFVLPDSYIDPVNKEYGGDKYINGQIIPRPPPIQYGRSGPNREFRSRPSTRGPMEGANRNYGPPGAPQQNFSSPPPPQRNFEGGNRNYGPPGAPQQNFSTPPPPQQNMEGPYRNYGPPPSTQQNFSTPPPANQNFGPSPPRPQQSFGSSPPQHNYGPPHPQQNFPQNQNYGPPPPQNYGPPPQQSFGQPGLGERGGFNPQGQSNFGQGNQGSYGTENRGFSGPSSQGGYGGQASPTSHGPSSQGGYGGQASPTSHGEENGPPYSQYNQRR